MTQETLAPVKWEMGQPLLPQHLHAQEQSLLADTSLRFQVSGLPSYGVCRFNWDAAILTQGCLQITELRLLNQGCTRMIDYPGNAKIISPPLELEKHHQPQVLYYIFEESLSTQLKMDSYAENLTEKINRRMFKIVLSCDHHFPEEYDALLKQHKLLEQGTLGVFEKNNQGEWRLTDSIIPPLMQIGASPYLSRPLKQLRTLARRFRVSLTQKYSPQNLPRAHIHDVKLCLNSLQTTLRLLENINFWDVAQGELQIHPYYLYESLQKLLSDITLFRGEWPEKEPVIYKHNQLHQVFKKIFQQLLPRLKMEKESVQSIELILEDGIYSCTIPNETTEKDDFYLVITDGGRNKVEINELPKASAKQRLQALNDYSLKGVELITIKQPALGYEFGPNFQCFKLGGGSERQAIQREKSFAFYAQSALKPFNFYLYTQSRKNRVQ
jgi:type VI secretion system protein ImpJ